MFMSKKIFFYKNMFDNFSYYLKPVWTIFEYLLLFPYVWLIYLFLLDPRLRRAETVFPSTALFSGLRLYALLSER